MSEANESAAATAVAEQPGIEQVVNAAGDAANAALDFSEAGVRSFLEAEMQKLSNPEPEAEPEKAAETPAEEPETVAEEPEDASTEEPEETETAEEASVFEQEDARPILTAEEIDENFKRTSIASRIEMKRYAEYAREHADFVNEIGGKDFLPVAAKITQAIAARDHNGVFTSLVTSLGLPSFSEILESAVDLAFVQPVTQAPPDNDDSKWFMGRLNEITDRAFEARFGSGIKTDSVDRLVRLQKVGAFDLDALEELYSDDLKPENSPVVEKLHTELARERAELDRLRKEQETVQQEESGKRLVAFDNVADQSVDRAFDPLFQQSVLRDVKGDKPEETQIKDALRKAVVLQAQEAFRKSESFRTLRERFQSGEASTSVFTADLGSSVNAAVREAKPFAAKFERLFKDTYLTKRNAVVLGANTPAPADAKPTETTQFDAGKSTKEMTDEEFDAYQKKVLMSLPAR